MPRRVARPCNFPGCPNLIHGQGVRFLLTWIIPYGFASFYPASYLLGRNVGPLAWLGPVVAALLLGVSYRVWQFGLRYYSGTGS